MAVWILGDVRYLAERKAGRIPYADSRDRPTTAPRQGDSVGAWMKHNDAPEPTRFPFDAIYKALCCHRQTIENILTGYLAEPIGPLPTAWIDRLDFDGLRKLSTEWVTREFRTRRGGPDMGSAIQGKGASRGLSAVCAAQSGVPVASRRLHGLAVP